jgi:hypothetical protein
MNRIQLLAAETFHYSYDNYADHVGVNVRFDRLMPDTVRTLEKAADEQWPLDRIARELDVDSETAKNLLESFERARLIVDAKSPAESFRTGVRFSIQDAVAEGLGDDKTIETLVTQICYRAADLSYLLKQQDRPLSDYSQELREEPGSVT